MPASLHDPLSLARGRPMANRFMLAPLTNQQSNPDGTLGDDEYNWLVKRAQGGFGLTMTCAAHVQRSGQGFPNQLGIWSDAQLPGLARLAAGIRAAGSLSSVQLQHSGQRAPRALIGEAPHSPWADAATGTRALSTGEIEQLVQDFVAAAVRAERAGFDGVELHGAHGYLLGQFLDADHNLRDDRYGGAFENRTRMLFEVVTGIRAETGPDFQLGLRLSPERFGIPLAEARLLSEQAMLQGELDFLDLSLWDVFGQPSEPQYQGTRLIDHFAGLARGRTRLGVAGKIMSARTAQDCLDHGMDYVLIGRGAILHHDFPRRAQNPGFDSIPRPVSRDHLRHEGLGEAFIDYVDSGWKGFVSD